MSIWAKDHPLWHLATLAAIAGVALVLNATALDAGEMRAFLMIVGGAFVTNRVFR